MVAFCGSIFIEDNQRSIYILPLGNTGVPAVQAGWFAAQDWSRITLERYPVTNYTTIVSAGFPPENADVDLTFI